MAMAYAYRDLLLFQKLGYTVRNEIFSRDIVGDFLMLVAIGFSTIPLFLSYYLKMDKKWIYTTQFLLSYLLAFFLINSSLNFFKGTVYNFTYGVLDQKVGDLGNYELYSTALSQNIMYQHFLGWSMLATAFLVCFRRTRPVGTVMGLALSLNIFFISHGFNFAHKEKGLLILAMSTYLLVSQWPFFSSVFLFNERAKKRKFPFPQNNRLYEVLAMGKMVTLIGLMVFLNFKKESNWLNRYSSKSNPIVGAWKIDSSQSTFEGNQTKDFLQAEIFYFDRGSTAFIEIDDSISRFKYLLDPNAEQFDMYDFHQLRDVDLKGKYELIDPDTLIFNGKNHRDSIIIQLSREKKYDRFKH